MFIYLDSGVLTFGLMFYASLPSTPKWLQDPRIIIVCRNKTQMVIKDEVLTHTAVEVDHKSVYCLVIHNHHHAGWPVIRGDGDALTGGTLELVRQGRDGCLVRVVGGFVGVVWSQVLEKAGDRKEHWWHSLSTMLSPTVASELSPPPTQMS